MTSRSPFSSHAEIHLLGMTHTSTDYTHHSAIS